MSVGQSVSDRLGHVMVEPGHSRGTVKPEQPVCTAKCQTDGVMLFQSFMITTLEATLRWRDKEV